MIESIDEAIRVFCEDILGFELQKGKSLGKNFYAASIPLYENEKEQNWYIFLKEATLKKIAKTLLLEEDLPKSEYDDLLKEVANQMIGLAKVKLEEKNKNTDYQLGTPEFLGNISAPLPIKLEDKILYKISNRTILVAKQVG